MTQLSPNILLRCTILDSHGSIKTISGLFRKSDLCSRHGLEPRDLRKIDSRVPNLVPTILARRSGILINVLHIRAMVKSDAVLLFDSYGAADSRVHSAFVQNLEHNLCLNTSSLPYEFRALESILASVLEALRSELGWLRLVVDDLLEALEDDIDREKLRMLLQISKKLNGFLSRSRGIKLAVTEVVESDEDMALMYLTDAKLGNPRDEQSNLEELELLLESFEKQVEEVLAEIEQIYANVNNTQEIVELILDSNRNRLLALDLRTSIVTLGVSTSTLFVGLFGMNLTSHLEEDPYAFYILSGIAYVMAIAVVVAGLRRLSKLRRIGLSSSASFDNKPDEHHISHARAWWWRENQFRVIRRERNSAMKYTHPSPYPYPEHNPNATPLDPAELNTEPKREKKGK
ncbi:Inner membrane magnesium transporter MRS2 [Malassezia vespertilionis]|uniref:Magnesium transporter n=1 Tax=Malassezia vespertilionis TaxID=2020962 RepID=A0A2N1JFC5_9BASI|nr:Inner membrane magnesium transporter MRS2 [Malassezia vespertilionis]PKI85264.1 Mrs2p [Malassezia vespertilionis]WFD05905.1 Inner membrane magnesium transporter MRS2 [Malassezia vespertilionis]